MKLVDKQCQSCSGITSALSAVEIKAFLIELPNWQVIDNQRLWKQCPTKDFRQSMHLANQITEIAEAEGHHPDLHISWGKLGIEIWTHKIGALTEADFILAAKIEEQVLQSVQT